ncbi:MAG TPA: HAD-IA family hydrolase [Thermoanaerobaculia bacterium]|jgi:phosphoglycolate phosphatase|nr:HAD-IA family hydrolase [Thermoanaerobaculia bacterium]
MPADSNPFRLLVFDWDGTLMDSIGTIVACTQATIRELELGELPEQTIRGTIGLGLKETVDILSPGCDEELYGRILETYRQHWHSTYRDMPLLFGGVGEMLEALAQEGYLLAVATGKSRRGLDYALDQTELRDLFHATRTADEAFSKPHPQMLLDILDELGVAPRDAVMIGDTTYDLEMARSARTHAVGVCSGGHCREELERFDPLACLDQVVELAPWLAKRAVMVTAS